LNKNGKSSDYRTAAADFFNRLLATGLEFLVTSCQFLGTLVTSWSQFQTLIQDIHLPVIETFTSLAKTSLSKKWFK